jgi:hypothetical protein
MDQRTVSSSLCFVLCFLDLALVAAYLDQQVYCLVDHSTNWLRPMNLAFQMYWGPEHHSACDYLAVENLKAIYYSNVCRL